MKLNELLDAELYKQVEAKINEVNAKEPDKLKHIRYADLSEGEYVSKEKYGALETDASAKSVELENAAELIKELKKGTATDPTLQTKITNYETEITKLQGENETLKVESALKFALQDAKAADVDYLAFKIKEKGEIKLDANGKIKGIEDTITGLKTQFPTQFVTGTGRKVEEHRLKTGGAPNNDDEPKTLAEALKQQYEETNQTN